MSNLIALRPRTDDPIIGSDLSGVTIQIDVPRLIETRLLACANSGGGKSWLLRRLLEQTHGQAQHLVIDPEGEFHTLREKFDYILVAKEGGDCRADVRSAALLARRLLELGVSAILDIYELHADERKEFVGKFLDALVNAPRALWHPALVVIDEAHVFCPEVGKESSSEAVKDLMTRGRKRGFCGILATQRLSKLHKDALAEANNYLIGRAVQDVDVKREGALLGFSGRADEMRLRALKPGAFFAFGPALSDDIREIHVGAVRSTHPKAGQRAIAAIPPRETVRAVLGQLADLAEAAEEEERTVEQLRARIKELESGRSVAADSEAIVAAEKRGYMRAANEAKEAWRPLMELVSRFSEKAPSLIPAEFECNDYATEPLVSVGAPEVVVAAKREHVAGGGAELRILRVLANRHPAKFTKQQWATLAGMKHSGGTWQTYVSRLRTQGLLMTEGSLFGVTPAGMKASGVTTPRPQSKTEVLATWKEAVGSGPSRILDVIARQGKITRNDLADAVQMTPSGGTFQTYLSRLRSNGLIEQHAGFFRLTEVLR